MHNRDTVFSIADSKLVLVRVITKVLYRSIWLTWCPQETLKVWNKVTAVRKTSDEHWITIHWWRTENEEAYEGTYEPEYVIAKPAAGSTGKKRPREGTSMPPAQDASSDDEDSDALAEAESTPQSTDVEVHLAGGLDSDEEPYIGPRDILNMPSR